MHGDVMVDMVLEEQLRLLHRVGNRKPTETLGSFLSIDNLKACPHSDTLPSTKPHLLIMLLLMSLWGPITFKLPPPHTHNKC